MPSMRKRVAAQVLYDFSRTLLCGLVTRSGLLRGRKSGNSGGSEEEAMTINDLPAIMGTVLLVGGLALVGIYTWFRTEGSEKSVEAGALLIVVGAVLLGLSLFVPHAK